VPEVAVSGELRQVFSNLLSNSLDAIDQQRSIRLHISTRDGYARVTVADNGQGIEAGVRNRIFEPLFTTKGTVGTGLGLWVSKQLIDKHHGRISVHSRTAGPRRGTTISIKLPLLGKGS